MKLNISSFLSEAPQGRSPHLEGYTLGDRIGQGAFSTVRKCVHQATGKELAVKIIDMRELKNSDALMDAPFSSERVMQEIQILRRLKHPNIVALVDAVEDQDYLYVIMELATGGELFDHIVKRGHLTERSARAVVREVLRAVQYLHEQGVCHRDIKPENILVSASEEGKEPELEGSVCKLSDFGLAKLGMAGLHHPEDDLSLSRRSSAGGSQSAPHAAVDSSTTRAARVPEPYKEEASVGRGRSHTVCGTPAYVAPEVFTGVYDHAVDVFSVGALMYVMLRGQLPPSCLATGDHPFDGAPWRDISREAKDLLGKLTNPDPVERITAAQALEHRWFTSQVPSTPLMSASSSVLKMRKISLMDLNAPHHNGQSSHAEVARAFGLDVPRMPCVPAFDGVHNTAAQPSQPAHGAASAECEGGGTSESQGALGEERLAWTDSVETLSVGCTPRTPHDAKGDTDGGERHQGHDSSEREESRNGKLERGVDEEVCESPKKKARAT